MLNRLFKAMVMQDNGVLCRSCGEAVHRHDQHGLSESVCRNCRS